MADIKLKDLDGTEQIFEGINTVRFVDVLDNFVDFVPPSTVETGTFTISSTQTTLTFTHTLGVAPNFIYVDNSGTSTSYTNRGMYNGTTGRACRGTTTASTTVTFTITTTDVSIPRSGSYSWATGTYKYIIGYIA